MPTICRMNCVAAESHSKPCSPPSAASSDASRVPTQDIGLLLVRWSGPVRGSRPLWRVSGIADGVCAIAAQRFGYSAPVDSAGGERAVTGSEIRSSTPYDDCQWISPAPPPVKNRSPGSAAVLHKVRFGPLAKFARCAISLVRASAQTAYPAVTPPEASWIQPIDWPCRAALGRPSPLDANAQFRACFRAETSSDGPARRHRGIAADFGSKRLAAVTTS